MKALIGFEKSKAMDSSASDLYGLSEDLLMNAAALGMLNALQENSFAKQAMKNASIPVLALVGYGNNGGDALALLRHLAFSGIYGLVAVVQKDLGPVTLRRLSEASLAGVKIVYPGELSVKDLVREATLVLDGISGTGFSGNYRPEMLELMSLLKMAEGKIVAVDIPSGIYPFSASAKPKDQNRELSVKAELSLSVAPLKKESYYPGFRSLHGKIVSINGVFPHDAASGSSSWLLEEEDLSAFLPSLEPDWHKGQRGTLFVYAGATGSSGAASLSCKAAQAAGCGSVTLLADGELLSTLASCLESQMVRPLSDPGTRKSTAILAGPGWGLKKDRETILDELLLAPQPLVLDADALRLLAKKTKPIREEALVLTPHPGEFLDLALNALNKSPDDKITADMIKDRIAYDSCNILAECAAFYNAVIVLKGSASWICEPSGQCFVWDGRDASLAVAGSGDVLAGVIAGFLARGLHAGLSAKLAVMIHGLSGRMARQEGFYDAAMLLPHIARLSYKEK